MTIAETAPQGRPAVAPSSVLVYKPEEAAVRIGGGCTKSWLKEQARLYKIPCTFIGGKYGFTEEHCAAIVALFERTPATRAAKPARQPRQAPVKPPASEPGNVTVLRARQPRPRQHAS